MLEQCQQNEIWVVLLLPDWFLIYWF